MKSHAFFCPIQIQEKGNANMADKLINTIIERFTIGEQGFALAHVRMAHQSRRSKQL